MWLLLATLTPASAQTLTNGDLDAEVPERVPNPELPVVDGWVFGDAYGWADVAIDGAVIHCADILVDPSPTGGTFAHATAIRFEPDTDERQGLSTVVTDLRAGEPYRVRFDAGIVRIFGQSAASWEVRLGSSVQRSPILEVPTADPAQGDWIGVVIDGLVADGPEVELRFEAVSEGDGAVSGVSLPNPPDCDYFSLQGAAELLLDGIQIIGDLDGDGTYDDEDPDRDGDGIDDLHELDPSWTLDVDRCPSETTSVATDDIPDSDPTLVNSDGDDLDDAQEGQLGTDPRDDDTDDDGLSDSLEVERGTDPRLCDTDGNGIPDGQEEPVDRSPPDIEIKPSIAGCDCDSTALPRGFLPPLVLLLLLGRRLRQSCHGSAPSHA